MAHMNGPICTDAGCYRRGEELVQRTLRERDGTIVIVRAHKPTSGTRSDFRDVHIP